MKIIEICKNILAPKKCYSCKKEGYFLCEDCFLEIGYFREICPICKQKSPNFEVHNYCIKKDYFLNKVIILTFYQNKYIKKLIKDAKFHQVKDIFKDISIPLGEHLFYHISEKSKDIILVSTPMYFWKKIKRGYNQSEILCENISKNYDIIYEKKLFKKVKNTKPQSHLSKIERIENLKNSLKIDEKLLMKYRQKTFIIIDDVVSTGTTLGEIAKILKQHGIKKVYGLCLASD